MPKQYRYSILPGGRRVLDVRKEAGEDEHAPAELPAGLVQEGMFPDYAAMTAAAVLEAVGGDAAKARTALDAEAARKPPRTTLVSALEKVIAA